MEEQSSRKKSVVAAVVLLVVAVALVWWGMTSIDKSGHTWTSTFAFYVGLAILSPVAVVVLVALCYIPFVIVVNCLRIVFTCNEDEEDTLIRKSSLRDTKKYNTFGNSMK